MDHSPGSVGAQWGLGYFFLGGGTRDRNFKTVFLAKYIFQKLKLKLNFNINCSKEDLADF